jgi:serine/threonine protein kinase
MLTLSNTRAKELAGRLVTIDGATYHFKSYDADHPGQPPWRSGAEGKAYPLLGDDQSIAAYLKFFTQPTSKRLNRTAWLIGQQMYAWLPHLAAAPVLWTDTRHGLSSEKIDFHFAAYLARAVPGETWLELKSGIAGGGKRFADDIRWRCVEDLLLSLAVLEQAGLVHGDLSPNNVVIDLDARPGVPALYLIDFDAFVAEAAGLNRAVTVAEGGTYGTEGYCPPDLAAAASEGDGAAAPFSDRYGRDMLLMEFLLMGYGLPADDPLGHWNPEQLRRQFAAWQARNDPPRTRALCHLNPAILFRLKESERPSSADLAAGLGVSLPQRRVLRRVTELPRSTPAILEHPSAITAMEDVSYQPMARIVRYGQRLTRFGRAFQPFYRPPPPAKHAGDDDLKVFIAILLGVASLFIWAAILAALMD